MKNWNALFLSICIICCFDDPAAADESVRFHAIYLDLDGTAIGAHETIRPATIEALDRYRDCGGRVGIATGRSLQQMRHFISDLKPDLPLVLYNGAVVYSPDGQTLLGASYLPSDLVATLFSRIGKIEDVDGVLAQGLDFSLVDRSSPRLDANLKKWNVPTEPPVQVVPKEMEKKIIKLMLIVRPKQAGRIRDLLAPMVGDGGRVLATSSLTVEIVATGVSKAVPILKILRDEGISARDTLTFGDSDNDVEMLSGVGAGFAMGNCRKSACEAAIARIGNNRTDAISDVIKKIAIHPECKK